MDAIWGDKFPKWAQSQMRNAWLFLEQLHIFWFRTAVYLVRFSCQIVQSYSHLFSKGMKHNHSVSIIFEAPSDNKAQLWRVPGDCPLRNAESWVASEASKASGRASETFQHLPTSGRLPWAFILIDFYRFLQIWLYQLYCCTMLHSFFFACFALPESSKAWSTCFLDIEISRA